MDAINDGNHRVAHELRDTSGSFNPHALFLNADSTGASVIDKNSDDRFGLILTEVLRLRTQVSSLQAQIAAFTHERDNASMLIWTEVSRLAHQLEQLDNMRGDTKAHLGLTLPSGHMNPSDYIRHSVGVTSDIKFTDPVIIRTLLGESNGCAPAKTSVEGNDSAASVSSNDDSQVDDRLSSDIKLKHNRNVLEESSVSKKALQSTKPAVLGDSPSTYTLGSNEQGSNECNKSKENGSLEATSEHLIHQWIAKQRIGERLRPELGVYKSGVHDSAWWCHVCGTLARDGPPGEHFCWSKIENGSRDGLKVFCHYCKKGTSRMPDLRVHFKKIVYCRLLRKELTRKYLGSQRCSGGPSEEPESPQDGGKRE